MQILTFCNTYSVEIAVTYINICANTYR